VYQKSCIFSFYLICGKWQILRHGVKVHVPQNSAGADLDII